jgi:cytochrome c biogenesis protein CcdA
MTDPLPAAVAAVLHGDAARVPIVALAGAVSSIGPCAAPRYVALATLLTEERRGLTIGAFVAGLMTAYAALGFGAGLLVLVTRSAAVLDAVLAAVLVAGGLVTLLRAPACDHTHGPAACKPRRLSGVFSLGAASALVVSPCCTPMIAAVAAFPGIDASPFVRAAMLGVFALGHALPIVLLGAAGTLVATRLRRWTAGPAPAVVSGSLMLALGAYYGLLV